MSKIFVKKLSKKWSKQFVRIQVKKLVKKKEPQGTMYLTANLQRSMVFTIKTYNLPICNIIVFITVTPKGYALGRGHHESSVHRNPYDAHDAYDAIRTQDADLAVSN